MYDFFDTAHLNAYLAGTILQFQGQPSWVRAAEMVRKVPMVSHLPLREAVEGRDLRSSPLHMFNLKPYPLGMYNFSVDGVIVEAAWMMRMPARRWKAGLDRHAIVIEPVRKAGDNVINEILHRRESHVGASWHTNQDMADMLEGKYPKLHQALHMIGKRTRCSIAFSRNFAVTGTKNIFYRHHLEPVGTVVGGMPSLHPAYMDLRDILMEDMREPEQADR